MIIISGGVISKQSGSSVTYKVKCDSCENIEPDETTITLTKGVTDISTKKCSICGNNQLVKLKFIEIESVKEKVTV